MGLRPLLPIGRILNSVSALTCRVNGTNNAFYAGAVDVWRHIAVIMNGNHIMTIGTNHMIIAKGGATHTTSKFTNRYSLTSIESIHAEADAISRYYASIKHKGVKANSRAKLTLYVFRVDRLGNLKMSRPCSGCQKKIIGCGSIKSVVSSTNDGFAEEKPRDYDIDVV